MCLTVFLASDRPLPRVNEDVVPPTFSVRPLAEREDSVRTQFSKLHVVSLGSHTGCGCGFAPGDPSNGAGRPDTIARLISFLEAETPADAVEIFVCWEGDHEKPPARRLRMSRAELADREDWTQELSFTIVDADLTQ